MLLLQDTREIVLEFLSSHITGSRYRDAVAVSCGCILLDVVLHIIVVNVVWGGQRERGAIGREREVLTMRPCRDRMLAKSRAILHVDDDVAMSE